MNPINNDDRSPRETTPASDESLAALLRAIPLAALKAFVRKIPPWAVGLTLTVCGLVLILSPLALWVSWTITIFNSVLGLAAVALVVAFALIMLSHEDQL